MSSSQPLSGISISPPTLILLLLITTISSLLTGTFSLNAVILGSIQIFDTHEWLVPKPTIYFQCQGDNKTVLPDVTEKHLPYIFKGEESWQPLTELPDKKCKRCGLYEMDSIKADDIFDEWELCRNNFLDGYYVHYKEKEFNATFSCPECIALFSPQPQGEVSEIKAHIVVVILISALASIVATIGSVAIYRYWRKRKREQEQARFLKLFDEGDDIEAELGLSF